MIKAEFNLGGEDIEVDWDMVHIDLFHQINRILDLEEAGTEQTIYFREADFMAIKKWVSEHWYTLLNPHQIPDHETIHIIIDGYSLTLKKK